MVIVVVVMRVMGIVLLMGTIPLCSTRASMSPCAPKHLGVYLFGVPIVATASILLAQAMDAPDALTCRRHRLDEALLAAAAARDALQRRMDAGVSPNEAQQRVEQHTGRERGQSLAHKNRRELTCFDALRHEQGQHLIGCGEEHGDKRSQGDDAPRIERRRHSREAALRDDTQQRTDARACRAGAVHQGACTVARRMLKRLEHQVRDEEERHEWQRILKRMFDQVKQ